MPVRNLPPQLTTQQAAAGTYTAGGQLQQIGEYNPDLRWPNSVAVYDQMRKDSKCAAVLRALKMPVRGTSWHVVDSPDVRPEITQMVRANLGLVEEGDTRRRRRGQGVSWDGVLRDALLAQDFGHMFFEPVYTIAPAPPDVALPPGMYAHLARLAPILPQTISGFEVADNGDLISVEQSASTQGGQWRRVTIPAEQLLAVVNDREGGDWAGTSILRAAYKDWLIKDKLERLAVTIVERNGMGVPVYKHSEDGDRVGGMRTATSFRGGDLSGISIPNTDDLVLLGVTGQTVDPLPQIEYHGQEIARSVLAMFMDLGHDNGARALGETFVDYFTMAINAVIADLEETFTEKLVRPLVALNFGDGEGYPEIVADEITPQAPLTAESLQSLVAAGVLTPDPTVEGFVRHAFGMPPLTAAAADEPPPEAPQDTIDVQAGGGGSHMSGLTLEQRRSRLAALRDAFGRRRR